MEDDMSTKPAHGFHLERARRFGGEDDDLVPGPDSGIGEALTEIAGRCCDQSAGFVQFTGDEQAGAAALEGTDRVVGLVLQP